MNSELKAVILAAGQGKRLMPLTETLPKGLIEIGGKSLLEYSLDALSQNGIKEVILIVGYFAESVKKKFGEEYQGSKIRYIVNHEYSKTGSMYSFSKAKDAISDSDTLILLESDLLYDAKAIELLLGCQYRDCILVAKLRNSGDEVYICVDENNRIINLGKDVSAESRRKAVGELVGISRFSGDFLEKLFRKAEEDYGKGERNYHYEECVFATSKVDAPVYALLYKDLIWTEIDNGKDLRQAEKKIFPQLKLNKE